MGPQALTSAIAEQFGLRPDKVERCDAPRSKMGLAAYRGALPSSAGPLALAGFAVGFSLQSRSVAGVMPQASREWLIRPENLPGILPELCSRMSSYDASLKMEQFDEEMDRAARTDRNLSSTT